MKKLIIIMLGIIVGVIIIYSIIGYLGSHTSKNVQTNNSESQKQTQPADTTPTTSDTVKNIAKEQNITTNNLTSKVWNWISTSYSNGDKAIPKDTTKFKLTFKPDGTFSSTTDCNGIGGKYVIKDNTITFSDMMSTLMYCDGSQENDYRKVFEESHTYKLSKTGELIIDLRFGAGNALFK